MNSDYPTWNLHPGPSQSEIERRRPLWQMLSMVRVVCFSPSSSSFLLLLLLLLLFVFVLLFLLHPLKYPPMTASRVFDHSGALNIKLLRAESDRPWNHDEGREGTRVRNGHLLNAHVCTIGKELELELELLVYMKSVTEYHWGHPRSVPEGVCEGRYSTPKSHRLHGLDERIYNPKDTQDQK